MAEMSRLQPFAFKTFESSVGSSIYAVTHLGLPGVVKIGRTRQWDMRRLAYRDHGGMSGAHVFTITHDYADIETLEQILIEQLPFEKHKPNEWFKAELSDISPIIEATMLGFDYSFRVEQFEMKMMSREHFGQFVERRAAQKGKPA